jgi:deoxycytidylate deaminase
MTCLQLLVKKAAQSTCRYRVAALGFNRNGDCVAKATNLHRFGHKGGGLHAEMRVMAQAKRKGVRSILICRIGNGGALKPIEPCECCARKAAELGIKITSVPAEN